MRLSSVLAFVACVAAAPAAFADPPVSIMKPGKMMSLISGDCAQGVLFVLAPGAALDDKTREPLYRAARNNGKCPAGTKVTEVSRADFIKTPQALAHVERMAVLLTRGNPRSFRWSRTVTSICSTPSQAIRLLQATRPIRQRCSQRGTRCAQTLRRYRRR